MIVINEPSKACDADLDNLDNLPYPLAIFLKLDGVRVLHKNGFYGRSMKLLRNPYLREVFNKPEYYGFDSEGTVGDPEAPNCVSVTSGAFSRSKDKPKEGKFVIVSAICHVFDDFSVEGGFVQRHANARRRIEAILAADPTAPLKIMDYVIVNNKEELLALEGPALERGCEGLIGRTLDGPYKQGRCTAREGYYLRFKRFEEREGIIEDFEEGQTNGNVATKGADGHTERSTAKENMTPNGQIGALWVRDLVSKELVKISSGRMTVVEAIAGFNDFAGLYKGRIAKYSVFAKGAGSFTKPRFPTFQTLRAPEDM